MKYLNKFYRLAREDARKARYPLYGLLVAAGDDYNAAMYLTGWFEQTKFDIATWVDEGFEVLNGGRLSKYKPGK